MSLSPATSHGGGLTRAYKSVLTGAAASIDSGANVIPATGDILMGWILARTAEAAALSTLQIQINGDTGANYDYQLVRGRNTTTTSPAVAGDTKVGVIVAGNSAAANYASVVRFTVPGYALTTFDKQGELTNGTTTSAVANDDVAAWTFSWRNTAAINQVAISVSGGSNLLTGSAMWLYIT